MKCYSVTGLPAPECSDNALRYKFSWNPRGVLLNTLGTAAYIQNGQIVQIAAGQLMRETRSLDFLPGFALEGFPNRDSSKYAKLYGIENESHTVLRGTLRFQGIIGIYRYSCRWYVQIIYCELWLSRGLKLCPTYGRTEAILCYKISYDEKRMRLTGLDTKKTNYNTEFMHSELI